MSPLHEQLRTNLAEVHARMRAACERSGRNPSDVRLVAVTKYAQWDWIRALVDLGQSDLAENRPQQFVERAARLSAETGAHAAEVAGCERPRVNWHLIGHLQRNKVRPVLPLVSLIHSVDSLRLLERIGLIAGELGLRPRVLLEVNVSGETSKDGFSPAELESAWPALAAVSQVEIEGLMTMAAESDDPEAARPVFRELRRLRDRLREASGRALPELSMGMSGDFEPAIEEGATLIRIGSRLFEGAPSAAPEDSL